jgi:sterol desaturase/sphingolipid hydroxylase (fatty acid hydroxylase superfamily)
MRWFSNLGIVFVEPHGQARGTSPHATSLFNHGNIRLAASIDRVLRLLVVTPEMHRVHHSVIIRETNSNFGFNLPWWDRLFGTYKDQPVAGHVEMTIASATSGIQKG